MFLWGLIPYFNLPILMKNTYDPRHNSRILAFQTLYQVQNDSLSDIISLEALQEEDEIVSYNSKLLNDLVLAARNEESFLQGIVTKYTNPNTDLVDATIIKLAITEYLILAKTPKQVVIDESVELAKELGGADDGKFVNGVLDNIFKNEKFELK